MTPSDGELRDNASARFRPLDPDAPPSEQLRRFVRGLAEIEDELGLPAQTFSQLLAAPDWALAVYLGALHEMALSQALAAALDKPGLDTFLRRLSVDGRASKLAMARALDLISSDQATALGAFAAMRNAFVHDFGMVNQTLHAWLHSLRDPRAHVCQLVKSVPVGTDAIAKIVSGDARDLRFVLWVAGTDLLRVLAAGKQKAAIEAKIRANWLAFGESVDQDIASDKVRPP